MGLEYPSVRIDLDTKGGKSTPHDPKLGVTTQSGAGYQIGGQRSAGRGFSIDQRLGAAMAGYRVSFSEFVQLKRVMQCAWSAIPRSGNKCALDLACAWAFLPCGTK